MSLNFSQTKATVDDHTLNGSLGELDNAVIALFWVGEKPRLGSLTITLPDKTSSMVLGDRDEMISTMVGERLASHYDKLTLVSTNLPHGFNVREVLRLLNRMISEDDE